MILGIDASQANRQNRSGTEWYAWHLLEQFKKLSAGRSDIQIRLYTRGALQSDLANNLPKNWEVRILRWPLKYFWGQIRLSWEMLVDPPDVLFCPAHTIPWIHPKRITSPNPSSRGGEKGEVGGTFTTLHDVGFKDYPELYDKLSLWYHRFSAWLAVKTAFHIFTISEFSRDRIIENYNCDPNRITVTHLGVDNRIPIMTQLSSLEDWGLKDKNYILYVGRIEPKKNILNIIRAFEMLTPSNSPSRGGEGELLLALAGRKLMDIPASPRIRILNYVPEADKWALYAGAAVFLFPTLYEGFGLPILEAQATKTPVITSNTASNPEIAGGGAVLVNPDSPHEIARGIISIINNDNLRDQVIKAGEENLKRFSWEQTAKQTWEVLLK